MRVFFLVILFLISCDLFACGVTDAKVIATHRFHDGHIFVNFDKPTSCDCSQTKRMAFRDDDMNMDYVKSMILMAYTTGASVSAYADQSCSVHSNTPALRVFHLNPK